MYCKLRQYPYSIRILDFLSNKASLFLLQYFQEIFLNCERSGPKLNKKANKKKPSEIYQLVILGKEVDLWCLLTGYSISYPPQPGLCDQCKLPFIDDNEDLVDDDNTEMKIKERDDENSEEIDKTLDILSKLTIEINQIEN
ncbi:742_t:CDS:2, partial [Funneliformis geosporum]